ncbi:glycoside hydrolase family 28 protein [Calocera viscosa TUFC12733]|uniref:galacturonan 1,4-alpha-galacturonidase n=1 Tax=Calocera viscosa (strain TUFC12733) TaxID=1330018 RepID=A0A167G8S9_CALVF|nr:glycoside hydrolase family 28 protein [Calocera viscosa TUFC12733]
MQLLAVLLALLPLGVSASVVKVNSTCTVVPVGKGGDDGPSILSAFAQCGQNGKIILDQYYSVNTVLNTTGLKNVSIELSGIVQYTPDIAYWSPNSIFLTYQNATTAWLLGGNNITLYGGGTIDGNGQVWYDGLKTIGSTGTAGGSSTTFARPVPLTIFNSSDVLITNITYLNSPFWNNFVYESSNVEYSFITMLSASYSNNSASNTDGWDIYRSDHITIHDCHITNGDDCVSFKPNTTNTWVYNMFCNGSHGISVGSLGQYAGETDIVSNVLVNNITMLNAQNGARIKVFGGNPSPNSTAGGGMGYVKNITYSNFFVNNTDFPITTNQCYSTDAATCEAYPSKVTISDVHYINVTGMSSGAENATVVTLECSEPCTNFTATGTHLLPPSKFGAPQYLCANITSPVLDFNCTAP